MARPTVRAPRFPTREERREAREERLKAALDRRMLDVVHAYRARRAALR